MPAARALGGYLGRMNWLRRTFIGDSGVRLEVILSVVIPLVLIAAVAVKLLVLG
jgi:hypothetical protein